MDPISAVGLLASIEGLIGGAFKTVSFLKTMKDGGKDRSRILSELIALRTVLADLMEHLNSDVEHHDPWLKTVAILDEDDGVFDQLAVIFEKLDNRLKPKTGHRKMLQTIRWPFDKTEIEVLVDQLERLKGSIHISITSTSVIALHAVLADTGTIMGETKIIANDTRSIKESRADEELRSTLVWISGLNYLSQ